MEKANVKQELETLKKWQSALKKWTAASPSLEEIELVRIATTMLEWPDTNGVELFRCGWIKPEEEFPYSDVVWITDLKKLARAYLAKVLQGGADEGILRKELGTYDE